MPLTDKPLSELLIYQGRNPKPGDFDEYWDTSLREMNALDGQVERIPNKTISSRFAECEDLWFSGIGGARIHAKFIRPRSSTRKNPTLLQFHGYGDSSGDWYDKLSYVSQQFNVAVLDCRGQWGLSEDVGGTKGNTISGHIIRGIDDKDPRKLLFRSIFLDVAQLAKIVMSFQEVDPIRVGVMGGSLGGALSLVCAALEPRIKLAASMHPFLCDYRRVWEMDLGDSAYHELTSYFRHVDPQHKRENEIFTKLGYIDCQYFAPRIKAEVLMFTGLMDRTCPPSTQFAAYNKISSPKDIFIYPDYGHEAIKGQGDLVFNFMSRL